MNRFPDFVTIELGPQLDAYLSRLAVATGRNQAEVIRSILLEVMLDDLRAHEEAA